MERKPPRPMTPFDHMTIPEHLYTLKLMLPYTPAEMQRMLAVYIKFQEFTYTVQNFHGFPHGSGPENILNDLKDYIPPEGREMMDQMEMVMGFMNGGPGFEDKEMFEQYSSMFDDVLNAFSDDDKKGE